MKRVAYFTLALLTFYLAAMYHSKSLVLLFAAELMLSICMWGLSRYLKRCLEIVFPEGIIARKQREECWCDCGILNRGRLPINCYQIRVRTRYLQETKGNVKFLHGASKAGIDQMRFEICALYCGMVCLEFERIRVYDYLGLFSESKVLSKELKIAILPFACPLQVDISSLEWKSENMGLENLVYCNEDVSNEIWQIREYRPEDSCRHIYWNQSARTDRIWIKEYEKEFNFEANILLEIDMLQWGNPKSMDRFYRLLYSLILGLIQKEHRVRVYWYEGHLKQLTEMEIKEEVQCQKLFLHLYQTNFPELPDMTAKALLESYSFTHDNYFKLDTELGWWWNETLIYRFSGENLEKEITTKVFVL